MKLLFTIWISAVLTQEVFSSALVRYPRHAMSKPTSSVHTEYEATYEQKGKHGNGSYSTVSGKQEVVHDNCHDNWNAFADKCATLIKDLVASLGNAVSSKPGDATNLQLRIRNTFKHFDSTDNCTCFTKNSLSSLFDNITASNAQPVVVQEEIIPSAQNSNSGQVQSGTCEGGSCNQESDSGQKVLSASQQRRGQPSLTLTNAEDVDPENADASKESSTTNSRRGVEYPGIIVKDPSQRSRGSGAVISEPKHSSPTSGSSSDTKKILSPIVGTSRPAPAPAKVIESPVEIVVPTSQSEGSTKTPTLKAIAPSQTSAPQQSSFQSASPVYRPTKNNNIVRSAIPVPPSSSASKISPPQTAAIRSPKEETPTESKSASNQTPFIVPVVLTEPVKSAAAKPQSDSSVSSAANGASGQIPSVISESEPLSGALPEPKITSIKSEGNKEEDCDEEKASGGSESVLTPVVPEPEIVSVTNEKSKDEECDDEKASESVPKVEQETISIKSEGNEEDCDEEKGSKGSATVLTPVVSEPETVPVKVEGEKEEEDCDEEKGSKGSESVLTPVVPVPKPEIVPVTNEGGKDEECDDEKGSESVPVGEQETIPIKNQGGNGEDGDEEKASGSILTPVVPVPEPEIVPVKVEGEKEEDCEEEKGSESVLTPVVPEPEIVPVKSEGDKEEDCDEEKAPGGSESVLTPVVPEPEIVPVKSEGDKEEDCDEEKASGGSESVLTPVVPEPEIVPVKSEGDKEEDCDEEKGSKGSESVLTPVVPVPEPEIVPVTNEGGKDEECDDEKGSESVPVVEQETISIKNQGGNGEDSDDETVSEVSEPVLTPDIPVADPETVPIKNEGDKDEACDEEKGSELEQIPVVPPVISAAEPQVTSTNADCDDEGASGNGSNQRPVVKPVTSTFQDPSTVVSDGSNPKSSVVPALPISDSGDSEMPVITQAADSTNQEPLSISDDPVPPEIASASDTFNVNPGLIVKQPQSQDSAQKNPSANVPLINSNSNLPDSTGPVDSAGTVNPSPIYRSLPTAPSATPSSDSEVKSTQPKQPTNKQEVGKPLANERDKTSQSISSIKGIPVAPTAASQRSQGKDGKEAGEKVFIVTPVPVYPEKAIVKPAEPTKESSKIVSPSKVSELTGVEYIKSTKNGGAVDTLPTGNGRQEITTPIPVIPVVTKEQSGDATKHSTSGKPSLQQHPLFTNLGSKKSAGNQQMTGEPIVLRPPSPPPKVVKVPAIQTTEDEDLTKPTTFQTTSTDPTPPQQNIQSPPLKNSVSITRPTSLPQDSFETSHGAQVTSPKTPHDDDDDDEEDCCSCESCTEEEVTNPKQYKEMACKDLEEARKELKAIFDKIKKRLKCGKKAPQKIVAS